MAYSLVLAVPVGFLTQKLAGDIAAEIINPYDDDSVKQWIAKQLIGKKAGTAAAGLVCTVMGDSIGAAFIANQALLLAGAKAFSHYAANLAIDTSFETIALDFDNTVDAFGFVSSLTKIVFNTISLNILDEGIPHLDDTPLKFCAQPLVEFCEEKWSDNIANAISFISTLDLA